MTPAAQRIAIAETEGFKRITLMEMGNSVELMGDLPPCRGLVHIPDYCNDLNAMHEVEKLLKGPTADEESERCKYAENLTIVCANGQEVVDVWYWDHITATASKRAEAFLKTIGKWVD